MYKIIKSNIKHAIDKTNFSTIYLEKNKIYSLLSRTIYL